MDIKGDKMVDGEFSPQGRIAVSAKDAHMMIEAAEAAGQDLPLGRTYLDILDKSAEAGDADLDNSAVIREIRRRKL
jgi:3-hydroxyisobutyrate dehydrogenase-like beta-hydroxyacid dehydrogenase